MKSGYVHVDCFQLRDADWVKHVCVIVKNDVHILFRVFFLPLFSHIVLLKYNELKLTHNAAHAVWLMCLCFFVCVGVCLYVMH